MTREEEYQNALNGYMNIDVPINKTLRLIGISAIKKQIPKKPIKILDCDVKVNWNSCPTCKKGIGWGKQHDVNYCVRCGQALDWSEDDD